MKIAEFKISDPDWGWDNTEVKVAIALPNEQTAQDVAEGIVEAYGRKVRWNWLHSMQGHYAGHQYPG